MIIAILAWIIAASICYLFLHRTIYNFGDPMIFDNISIPFSAALLTVLCAVQLVAGEKLILFILVLIGFLTGVRTATAFFGREQLRRAIIGSISRLSRAEIYFILISTMLVTLVLTGLAIQGGGLGDGRQDFNRSFRPLSILRSGLFLFSLLALLSPKLSFRQVAIWLGMLVLLSIAFSGKSVFIPIFYWIGLKFFITKKRASLKMLVSLGVVLLGGVGVMGLLAYGASSVADLVVLTTNRFWMYGDVYIYAYKLDALSLIRGQYKVSFLSYMLHPITSLIGIRGYDKPLGSMIMSQVVHADVLGGPNPQLPVLLDFFFPNQIAISITIAFAIGVLVCGIRVIGVRLAQGRSRYLAVGGIGAAIFCPAAGFVDTSQVMIALVGIVAVTFCGTIMELFPLRWPRSVRSFGAALDTDQGKGAD